MVFYLPGSGKPNIYKVWHQPDFEVLGMLLTIFAEGEWEEREIKGKRRLAYPIAYDYGSFMGTGLVYGYRKIELALATPKMVIASWRGMKTAELVKEFGDNTLIACWHAGNRHVSPEHQKYIDEIEAKIGKYARERILETVPEDLEDILAMLQERGIYSDGWEIEEEIRNGTLKATPKIQSYLDDFYREQELLKQEEYGRIITPEEAEAAIADSPFAGDVGKQFLTAYNRHINPATEIAVRHRDSGIREDYIIAKSREDEKVEVTIRGGVIYLPVTELQPILEIGLQYGGNDVEFQPRTPQEPPQLYHIFGLNKTKGQKMSEKFPLLKREYGAIVFPTGDTENPTIQIQVRDKRLEELANQLYQSVLSLRTTKILPLRFFLP